MCVCVHIYEPLILPRGLAAAGLHQSTGLLPELLRSLGTWEHDHKPIILKHLKTGDEWEFRTVNQIS